MKTHFVMMANYNAWANARLFRAAGMLTEALYRKEVGAYFRSLHGTLNHLLVADRIWMHRLTGTGEHPEKLDAILFADLPILHAARVEEERRIIAFVQSLDELAFEEALEYRTLNGTPQRQRRREILAHLFEYVDVAATGFRLCGSEIIELPSGKRFLCQTFSGPATNSNARPSG
jgi:uncharacterized damage-inducible protein DinB